MKQAYLKCFLALLAGSCVTLIAPMMAIPTPVNTTPVTSNYNRYMKIGYAATTKRNYKEALTNFRNAPKLRPNDKYALRATDNISRYATALRGNIITYIPRNTGSPNDRFSQRITSSQTGRSRLFICSKWHLVRCSSNPLPSTSI